MARRYRPGGAIPVPVFVEIISLKNSEQILLDAIENKLQLSTEMMEDFLNNGEVCSLPDGYNEILDALVKKIAREIDDFYCV